MSRPLRIATSNERLSGWCPTCQCPVPAESTTNLSLGSFDASRPSANGERQMFPRQTIKILTGITNIKSRHEVGCYFNYKESFLWMSSTNFLNCLSVDTRLSTVLQACNTVAWSRSPICEPMLANEAFVNFFAKNIANWRAWTT